MGTHATPLDDDMPAEIDFSKGTRGKFYRSATRIYLPIYLDDQVHATLQAPGQRQGCRALRPRQ